MMSFTELLGPLTCSPVQTNCAAHWNRIRAVLGITGDGGTPGPPDAGNPDGGQHAAPEARWRFFRLLEHGRQRGRLPRPGRHRPSVGGGDGCLWGSEVPTSPDVSPSGLAEQYVRQERWRRWDEALAEVPVAAGQRVLDLGCGVGDVTARLVRLGARVTGVDRDEDLLAVARARWPDVDFERADVRSLTPATFGTVDGIWSSFLPAYFPARAAAHRLGQVPGGRRVVRAGGDGGPARAHAARTQSRRTGPELLRGSAAGWRRDPRLPLGRPARGGAGDRGAPRGVPERPPRRRAELCRSRRPGGPERLAPSPRTDGRAPGVPWSEILAVRARVPRRARLDGAPERYHSSWWSRGKTDRGTSPQRYFGPT